MKKRSVIAVIIALSAHLWRAYRKLSNLPEPFSYEELTGNLTDATRHSIAVDNGRVGGKKRTISVLATPPGESGKTLVFLHGFKMRAVTWSLMWNEARKRGHRLIAPDFAGHGESSISDGAITLSSMSDDIYHVLEHFDVSQGALVGHSLGGFLAIQYLLDHPGHAAQRLPNGFSCIACTAGNWSYFLGGGNWHGELLMKTGIFDFLMSLDVIAEILMAKKFGSTGAANLAAVRVVVEASRAGSKRKDLKNMSDFTWDSNLHPEIPKIRLPSVVIVGSLDDHHPHPEMSTALRTSFQATGLLRAYKVMDEVGHFIPLVRPKQALDATELLWQ